MNINRLLIYGILLSLPLERIPSLSLGPDQTTIRISQILGLILILVNLPSILSGYKNYVRPPWVFLIIFNILGVASAVLSKHPQHSLKICLFMGYVSLLAAALSEAYDQKYLRQYAKYALMGVVGSCIFGIYQFFGDLAGLPGYVTGLRDQYMKGGIFPFPRVQSTGLEPLYFANYLLVPLSLSLLFQAFHRTKIWPINILIITIISLTLSRGAQVAAALIVVAVIGACLYRRQIKPSGQIAITALGGVMLSLVMIGLGSYLYGDIYGTTKPTARGSVEKFTHQATNTREGESSEGRALTRELAIESIKDQPLQGIGPGNFGYYAHDKRPEKFTTDTTIVNNQTLETASENGIFGLLSLGLFGLSLFLAGLRYINAASSRISKIVVSGLMIGLIATALQYQLFSTLYITHVWVAIGFLIATSRPRLVSRA